MRKQVLYIIICLMSSSLMGCMVGYKTFSIDAKSNDQPVPSLENVRITCDSNQVQNILSKRYHIADIQVKLENVSDSERFRIRFDHMRDNSNMVGTWAQINGFSVAIIPAILSEYHIYRFTIYSPSGELKVYDYKFTERFYSWLPLYAFFIFSPGYLEDAYGMKSDSYKEKRESIFEDIIIPRLMIDAAPFLLSKPSQTIK